MVNIYPFPASVLRSINYSCLPVSCPLHLTWKLVCFLLPCRWRRPPPDGALRHAHGEGEVQGQAALRETHKIPSAHGIQPLQVRPCASPSPRRNLFRWDQVHIPVQDATSSGETWCLTQSMMQTLQVWPRVSSSAINKLFRPDLVPLPVQDTTSPGET